VPVAPAGERLPGEAALSAAPSRRWEDAENDAPNELAAASADGWPSPASASCSAAGGPPPPPPLLSAARTQPSFGTSVVARLREGFAEPWQSDDERVRQEPLVAKRQRSASGGQRVLTARGAAADCSLFGAPPPAAKLPPGLGYRPLVTLGCQATFTRR
jgi:hypothetical protein